MIKIKPCFRSQLAVGVASALALSLSLRLIADTASNTVLNVNIESDFANVALLELAEQAGVQIIVPKEVGSVTVLSALDGEYSLQDALDRILAGSGLTYEFTSEQSVMIKENLGGAEGKNKPLSRGKSAEMEEMMVTATKRSVALQNVSTAVSALSGDLLEKMNAVQFTDYARSVPGLSFTDMGNGNQVVAVRGINPTTGVSTTAFYLGETPLGETFGGTGASRGLANPNLIDINRVEVLRGPQGTLYGAGSVGGTVKLVPNTPDLNDWSGNIKTGLSTVDGGGFGHKVSGVLNVPVIENTLAFRVAGWFRKDEGFVDRQSLTGETFEEDVGGSEVGGFRILGRFAVNESVELTGMVLHEEQEYSGYQHITGGAFNPDEDLVQAVGADVPEPSMFNYTLYNLTVNASFGNFNLISSSSYFDNEREYNEEGVGIIGQLFGDATFPNVWEDIHSQEEFTQEVRLSALERMAGFDFILGAYYNDKDMRRDVFWKPDGWNSRFADDDPSNPNYIADNNLLTAPITLFHKEFSVFGEVSYEISDGLILTGGFRRFDIERGDNNWGSGLLYTGDNVLTEFPSNPFSGKGSVYKANLSYQVTDNHLLYIQYSEGFRPGYGLFPFPDTVVDQCADDFAALGFTASPTQVEPDTVENYEFGAKTQWLEERLTLNASVFNMDWVDLQTRTFLSCGWVLDGNSQNGVTSTGVEVESSFQFTDAFLAGLNFSYIDATFEADEPALIVNAGDRIQDVPEWQASVYGEYNFNVNASWEGFVRMDVQHTDGSYSDFSRLSDGITRDPLSKRESTTLVNFRVSLTSGAWDVAFFGRNLLNDIERQDRFTSAIINVAGRPRYPINRPRSFGVEVQRHF